MGTMMMEKNSSPPDAVEQCRDEITDAQLKHHRNNSVFQRSEDGLAEAFVGKGSDVVFRPHKISQPLGSQVGVCKTEDQGIGQRKNDHRSDAEHRRQEQDGHVPPVALSELF